MRFAAALRTIALVSICLTATSDDRSAAQTIETLPSTTTLAPADADLWWDKLQSAPLNSVEQPLGIGLEAVVGRVLSCSPHVRIVADEPVLRGAQVVDASSQFDPRAFLDSRFTDTSDPVGNILTTGGANRYLNQNFVNSGGLRQQFASGAKAEVAQKFGYEDSNSRFFIPPNQGTSRISLTVTQPLLRGAGSSYNLSSVYLAEPGVGAASGRLQKELQDHIVESHRAYWDLRVQRSALLQRAKLRQQALDILAELEGRADFDVVQSQIVRAKAAAATREAAVIRFGTNAANAATRLRTLLNDPNLLNPPQELIPVHAPLSYPTRASLAQALTDALQSRPEIPSDLTKVVQASARGEIPHN